MTLLHFEVGIVSADRALVDFLAEVFELKELPPFQTQVGTLHRLQSPAATLKIMVPLAPPKPADRTDPFHTVVGLRYMTLRVDDLDAVIARSDARGGHVSHGPIELQPGVLMVVLEDPDGNVIEVVQGPVPGL